MSDSTPRLRIPELVSMQEMNVATWNEALVRLDAFVDLYLLGQFVNTPPGSPADGDAYLLGGSPTGAWSGYAYKIASCIDGAWRFTTPFNGLRAYVATTGSFIVYVNGTWTDWNSLISANEVSIASAATCDLGAAASLFVQITGTTTITSFGTGANKLRFVRFAQALTLTHNATGLILLGGASRTTAANDVGVFASDGSGNWRERSYFRAAANPGDTATKSGTETLSGKTFSGITYFPNGMVDADGKVGFGTTSLSAQVEVSKTSGTNNVAKFLGSAGGYTAINQYGMFLAHGINPSCSIQGTGIVSLQINNTDYNNWSIEQSRYTAAGNLEFNCAYAARMVLTSAGRVGINLGTASPNSSAMLDVGGSIYPHADNTYDLGSASYRFGTVYAGTGTINTSGADTKTNIAALSAAEITVAKALAGIVRVFQFCDAVTKKGADAARLHIGQIYEDVVAAFAAQGLDPLRYGIVCRDRAMKTVLKTRVTQVEGADVEETYEVCEPDLDETGKQKWVLGLRYDELTQFLMAGLTARIAALEAA